MTQKTASAVEEVLAASFLEGGWGALNDTTAELTAEQRHQGQLTKYENALDIAKPFMDDNGAVCLNRLRAMTVLQPTWAPESVSAMDGAAAGFAREGQNSLIRFIETCIQVAEAGPPAPLPPKE